MIWKDVDKDGSGTLSLSELTDRFLIAFELRQEREARLLKEQPPRTVPSPDDDDEVRDFQARDTDTDGFLNMNETSAEEPDPFADDYDASNRPELEMERAMRQLDKEMEQLMFTQADANRDGLLSPKEFVHYRHEVRETDPAFRALLRKQSTLDAKHHFEDLDLDGSGELDEPEVLKGVHDGHLSDFTHPEDIKDEL